MLASSLSSALNGRLLGDDIEITAIRQLDCAQKTDLSVLLRPQDLRRARLSGAGCLLLGESDAADNAHEMPCSVIVVERPFSALKDAIELLYQQKTQRVNVTIDARAHIDANATIGEDAHIFPFAYVGRAKIGAGTRIMPFSFIDDDVEIGTDCTIGAGCVIMSGTRVGSRVQLQPGAILGGDGFMYYTDASHTCKMPHIASVRIGDDVEIGAGTCIDRGVLEHTRIGSGTKIDNQVQVGHDVYIGEDVIIAGQSGIAGHATIGSYTSLGGKVGVAPHRRIGHGVQVSAAANVFADVEDEQIVSGSPAIPHMDYLRAAAAQKKWGKYQNELRLLRQRIEQLEKAVKR